MNGVRAAAAGSEAELKADRKLGFWLLLLVFLAHGYFVGARGGNQDAHFSSILAFVEPGTKVTGTFHIDEFVSAGTQAGVTSDWARVGDHYYSNKAPGLPMLGVPVYALISYAERAAGLDPLSPVLRNVNAGLLNLVITVFGGAVASVMIFRLGRLVRGSTRAGTLGIALVYAFGTLILPYDASLWSHSPAATLLVLALGFVLAGGRRGPFVGGLFAGLAVLVEYQATAAVTGLAAALLFSRQRRRELFAFAAGTLPGVAVLAVYQKVCFGGFLVTATAWNNPAFQGAGKLAGQFGLPSPIVLLEMLVSRRYGLFVFMPILLFALPDLWRALRTRLDDHRPFLWLPIAAVATMVSCFNSPDAGWASGPRYLISALPFLCLALPDPTLLSPRSRTLFGLLALVSAFNMLAIVSVDVMSPQTLANPLYGEIYPAFALGRSRTGTDFGRLVLGLPLHASAAVWSVCVIAGAGALYLRGRRR